VVPFNAKHRLYAGHGAVSTLAAAFCLGMFADALTRVGATTLQVAFLILKLDV